MQIGKLLLDGLHNRRLFVVSIVLSLLFSSFLVLGYWVAQKNPDTFGVIHVALIFVCAIPLFVAIVLLMGALDKASMRTPSEIPSEPSMADSTKIKDKYGCFNPMSPASRVLVFVLLLVAWLPVFLAAFPGFFCYDMTGSPYAEWTQFESGEFRADMPLAHTLLLGIFLQTSLSVTGSINAGIAVFVSFQAIIVSAVFTFMLRCIFTATKRRWLYFGGVAYLALNPLVSMFVMCTTRDTLFSAFVVLLCCLLFCVFDESFKHRSIETTEPVSQESEPTGEASTQPASIQSRASIGLFICIGVASFAVCIFRNNGIIGILALIPFAIFCTCDKRIRIMFGSVFACVLGVFLIWTGPISSAIGLGDSYHPTRSLVYSIPVQQIAYTRQYVIYPSDGNDINEELRKEELDMLKDADYGRTNRDGRRTYSSYLPQNADSARNNIRSVSDGDFWQIYFTFGLNHPSAYLWAFLEQTQVFWSPYAYSDAYETGVYKDRETSLFEFNWETPAEHQSLFPALSDLLENISTKTDVYKIPVVSLLFSLPLYTWTLLLLVARLIITKDKRILLPTVLMVVLSITAFFGPCALIRYYLYLIFGFPLMISFLIYAKPKYLRP